MLSKMEFDCKLAHTGEIVRVSGFNSIKSLYEKICTVFSISTDEIMYCTLNTHNFRDMGALLGNYLSFGDLIVVHLVGAVREHSFKKTQEYLGLTITDNGIGKAFVKKVKSQDGKIEQIVLPGDHISAINCDSTNGMRHYEVAKAIRDVPQMSNFSLRLVTPLFSDKYLDQNSKGNFENKTKMDLRSGRASMRLSNYTDSTFISPQRINKPVSSLIHSQDNHETGISDSIYDDLTNSSLPFERLLSKGPDQIDKGCANLLEAKKDNYLAIIENINSILESFLGINDNALAIKLFRLAKDNKHSFDDFSSAIKHSDLGLFNFAEDIQKYLWECSKA